MVYRNGFQQFHDNHFKNTYTLVNIAVKNKAKGMSCSSPGDSQSFIRISEKRPDLINTMPGVQSTYQGNVEQNGGGRERGGRQGRVSGLNVLARGTISFGMYIYNSCKQVTSTSELVYTEWCIDRTWEVLYHWDGINFPPIRNRLAGHIRNS